jgi:flagellar basal-body rod protein FlgC
MDPLVAASRIANHALLANSTRVRVATENVANAYSTARVPGEDPYRRKTISLEAVDEGTVSSVRVDDISTDARPFRLEHEPGHPAADARGYVAYPNVDLMTELADIREANRSYIANLQVIRQTRDAINATIDLLRNS